MLVKETCRSKMFSQCNTVFLTVQSTVILYSHIWYNLQNYVYFYRLFRLQAFQRNSFCEQRFNGGICIGMTTFETECISMTNDRVNKIMDMTVRQMSIIDVNRLTRKKAFCRSVHWGYMSHQGVFLMYILERLSFSYLTLRNNICNGPSQSWNCNLFNNA